MRILGILFLSVFAIIAVYVAQGRIQYWDAASVDYAIAAERIAAIKSGGRQNLDLSDLKHLSDLPPEIAAKTDLTRLNLSNTDVTDIGSLSELKKLENLSMNNVPVQDLSPLSALGNLVDLGISRTWIYDLSPIAGMSKLEQLNLSYTAVKSLEPVVQLRGIEQLTLYRSFAYDGSQEHFTKLERDLPRVNNGAAYKQNYRPGWMYKLKIRYQRFTESWMVDRPEIS